MEEHERHFVFGMCWCFAVLLLFALVGPLVTYAYLAALPWNDASCFVEDKGLSPGACSAEECAPPWDVPGGLRYCPGTVSAGQSEVAVSFHAPRRSWDSPDAGLYSLSPSTEPNHSGIAAAQRCTRQHFHGGACQRLVQGDDFEPLSMECKYYAWALVRVAEPDGALKTHDTPLCAYPLGLDGFNVNNLEDRSWDSQCTLYEQLVDAGETTRCWWRLTSLSQRPRVAFAPALTRRLGNEVALILRYTFACWLACLGCLVGAACSGSGRVLGILGFLLLANLILVTAVDLCQDLPICSGVVIMALFLTLWSSVVAGDWHLSRSLSLQRWSILAVLAFLAYVGIGSLYFVDDLSVVLSFLARSAASVVFLGVIRSLHKDLGLSSPGQQVSPASHPLLNEALAADLQSAASYYAVACRSCGQELLLCPCWPYPILCTRCVLSCSWWLAALGLARDERGNAARFSLTRLGNYFYAVKPLSLSVNDEESVLSQSSAQVTDLEPEMCLVCQEESAHANCIFLPCGHSGLCECCARVMLESRHVRKTCHMCRMPIDRVVKLDAPSGAAGVTGTLMAELRA
eukprot:TRINITY_DN39392_c0_g1_i1.p1 TRINITY_DN39392_c0_g1~~TRINITY_DN39392_c0_g1_i1.p1  ORF type:complete len:573 (+),score=41.75 TRINITY_DN39392_c0_g1_i1:157-1875(+)